mgnify:CR=1 FL=1
MTKNTSRDSKLFVNFLATLIQMLLNYGISFMLTPFIVENVGSEAYGFVSLGNNLVNYATIVTIALNSVAGRFITISVHQGNKEEGNKYFNSVLWANVILAGLIGVIFLFIILRVEVIFDVPITLIEDVRQLFIFIVINFMITIICNVFTVATFINNKLYLTNLGNCLGAIFRVLSIVLMYKLFPIKIAYVGLSSLICTIFVSCYNAIITKKADLGLYVDIQAFSLKKIKELFAAGIWNSVTKLSQVLSDGLDLLLCNLALNATAMGALSVAYTIPTLISGAISAISAIFAPQLTFYYAKNDIEEVVSQIKMNMKLMGFFVSICLAGAIVYGKDFFRLWTPSQDIDLVYSLAVIACSSVVVSGVTSALNNVFLLTNHLKVNSLVWLAASIFDAVCAFILVKFTSLGVYAIAGVSKIVGLILNITYTPIYASKCLKISSKHFYGLLFKYLTAFILICCEMFCINHFIVFSSINWGTFIIKCIISAAIAGLTNYCLFLNKYERKVLVTKFIKR